MNLYDWKSKLLKSLEHSGKLRTCAFSNDSSLLASGSEDGSVKIWQTDDEGKAVCYIEQESCERTRIRSLAISDDNNKIAISIYDTNIYVFSIENQMLLAKIGNLFHVKHIGSPFIVSNHSELVVGGDDNNCIGYAWKWNSLNSDPLQLIGHTRGIRSIALNLKYYLTGSYDTTVRIWNKRAETIKIIYQHIKPVLVLRFYSSDNNIFFSGSEDCSIMMYEIKSDKIIQKVHGFEELGDWVRGISANSNSDSILAILANRTNIVIPLNSRKYSSFFYKILYPLEFLYIATVISELIQLYQLFSSERYALGALSLAVILLPNIIYFLLNLRTFTGNKKKCLIEFMLTFLWMKIPIELKNNWDSPTYLGESRVSTKGLRYIKIIDSVYRCIPQTLISLYYILISPFIQYFQILTISLAFISIVKALGYGYKDLKYDFICKILLVFYRVCELVPKIGLLGLFCTVVYPAYIFIYIFSSCCLQFIIMRPERTDANKHWSEIFLKYTEIFANSFSFVFSEQPIVKRSVKSKQLEPTYSNTILLNKLRLPTNENVTRHIIAAHALIIHVVIQELFHIVTNGVLMIIILIYNTKFTYCVIGLSIIMAIKWPIPLIIQRKKSAKLEPI